MKNDRLLTIKEELSRGINNKDKDSADLLDEFVSFLSAWSIVGLDLDEVHTLISGKSIKLYKANNKEEFKDLAKDIRLKPLILCMDLPKYCDKCHISAFLELTTKNLSPESEVLWYAQLNRKMGFKVIIASQEV